MSTHDGVNKGVDKGVRILSLDSGGPGTYSQLLIIKEYMVRLADDLGVEEGDIYPADYFDLMGGVGFGGLVAILLGHLRMNVDEAIDALLAVALAIFPNEPRPPFDPESNTRQLSGAVENILQTRGFPSDRKMQEKGEEPVRCKVALYAATTANLSHPIVLRTYKSRGSSLNPTVVQAICATMATPLYFAPIKIGPPGRQQTFIGGPLGTNNPTRELLKQANVIFGNEKLVAQILSIGCGRSHLASMDNYASAEDVSQLAQEMAADCETVSKDLSARLFEIDAYLRLNVDRGMENLLMEEWNDLGPIESHTSAYVETAAVSENLEASLRRLQECTGTITLGQINRPSTIKDIQDNLGKQKEEFERALKSFRDNEDSRILERLKPVDRPSYEENQSCMEGTRAALLEDIVAWAVGTSSQVNSSNGTKDSIFWLYGMPGVGKTHVANSLCRRLHQTGNLGGTFFCRRDDPNLNKPKRVLPTLIYRLAEIWSPYRKLVAQKLRDDPQLNPDVTGCQSLLNSLNSLQEHPPHALVLVIDALDECGEPRTLRALFNCLTEACSQIPWLKVVVTSRQERDINPFFENVGVTGRDLAVEKQVDDDIRLFMKDRMASVAKGRNLQPGWPGEERLNQIVARSAGLFIFANTVCLLVDDPDPEEPLHLVLTGELDEANAELHKLYSNILRSRIQRNKEKFRSFLRAVIAVATYRSLRDETLACLLGLEPRVVRSWVDELGSLLYRDGSAKGGVRPRHLSIIEFLMSPTCPPEFQVDLQQANAELGQYCLKRMTKELKFNMCELETSCVSNADIRDLDVRVQEKISDALQYSSMHWSSHLCSYLAPASTEVSNLLDEFLMGTRSLYWMEVLSVMGKVPTAIAALRQMKPRIKKFQKRHIDLVDDALRFLLAFYTPISTSTPHLYISALPFTPTESNIWKHASKSFPRLMTVNGRMQSWPARPGIWQGHTDRVLSVAYSPEGRHVVSGSSDETIRIWDVETGAAVGEPLRGHSDTVWSVAYSPDGRQFASGSHDKTICIWDAETGMEVGEPLKGHDRAVMSVAYSPNGSRIASGSEDKTVRIWDAATGEAVGEPFIGHVDTVWSVAYSPDGHRVISGSQDKTIRIWDTETGAAVTLREHDDTVWCVAYSPDGHHIVSGSRDKTIRIWDAETGAVVGEPLRGHEDTVWRVSYSPDGRQIVSGSHDKTIRIWDTETGVELGKPLRGHDRAVWSVAYSPDGCHILSGSSDKTIRIWDLETGGTVGEPLKGDELAVWSVAHSPNGRHVVSGASDKTIRIWDVETGEEVCDPLRGHDDIVWSAAYSPDGRYILSGSSDKTLRIWDSRTGKAVGEPLRGHTNTVRSVAYSPDGRKVVSGSHDHTVRIWDAETGEAQGEPLRGHARGICSVAYSSDGRHIVSCSVDGATRIWDVETRAAIDDPNVASLSSDKPIPVWDPETETEDRGEPMRYIHLLDGVISSLPIPSSSGSRDSRSHIWHERNLVPAKCDAPISSSGESVGNCTEFHPQLYSNGWVRHGEDILFWVPEDCRRGLTSPGTVSIPITGQQRSVRLDFTQFRHGNSWVDVYQG